MSHRVMWVAALFLLGALMQGCTKRTADVVRPTPVTAEPLWDGGEFAGRPVYSLSHGVSQAARERFANCGLSDEHIRLAVDGFVTEGPPLGDRSRRTVLQSGRSPNEVEWSVAMNVTLLTADVFEVTCEGIRGP